MLNEPSNIPRLILSEGIAAIGDRAWEDVRLIAFEKRSVLLVFNEVEQYRILLDEAGDTALFRFLGRIKAARMNEETHATFDLSMGRETVRLAQMRAG